MIASMVMTGTIVLAGGCSGQATKVNTTEKEEPAEPSETNTIIDTIPKGAFYTNIYRNVFKECGYSEEDINKKVNQAWRDLFYGGSDTKIFYTSGEDEAYILDTGNGDVRSEGMSYGMMMCVQMDRKKEFDKLWKWAKCHMQITSGPNKGYFAWSMHEDGTPNSNGPAPDGEEYFAMSLFFASHRWGDGEAPFDYSNQARAILKQALHKPDNAIDGYSMWDKNTKLIRFVPESSFTDPSYHLPHFYELFSLWADQEDRQFWKDAATASRKYLKTACHPVTGLAPDYATFTGIPVSNNAYHDIFAFDAFRVAGNIGLDYLWFEADPWQKEEANRLQAFFVKEGIGKHYSNYSVSGKPLEGTNFQSTGLVAMNAMASLAADGPNVKLMVDDLWSKSSGRGQWRYYDNCLYFFSVLALSGNYKVWQPTS